MRQRLYLDRVAVFFSILFWALGTSLGLADETPTPESSVPNSPATFRAEVYGLFQWSTEADPGNLNPFDPADCSFDTVFTRPDGTRVQVPGFYDQDFEGGDQLHSSGKPKWTVRFCPALPGAYTFTPSLRIGKKTMNLPPATLVAAESQNPGFIQPGSPNNLYFGLTSGGSFYPVGLSVAWTSREKLLEDYEDYFKKLHENGANFTRVWNCEWDLPLEGIINDPWLGSCSLGRYNLQTAWRMDRLFELARQYGIRIILTISTYSEIMMEKGPWNEQAWLRNPYNSKNGGPCGNPWDFFINSKAKIFFKNRLRYLAARWGWCPGLFALELANEVNAPPDWVKEMADTFLSNDPNRHMVTISQGFPWGKPYDASRVFSQGEIGYSQKHYYGHGYSGWDMAEEVHLSSLEMTSRYEKPFFFEEIGLDGLKDDADYDTQGLGIHLHNALWAGVASLSAAAPLSHWKEYVSKRGLFWEFKAVAAFANSVDWVSESWKPLVATQTLVEPGDKPSDLELPGDGDWEAKNSKPMTVHSDGTVSGSFASFMKTTAREGIPIKLELDGTRGVTLTLRVEKVSVGADVQVSVDGKAVTQWNFDPSPDSGDPYQSTHKDPQWNTDVADYHRDYAVAIPSGQHEVILENQGRDWLLLEGITLGGMKLGNQVKLYGLSGDHTILGWIQDKRDNWKNVYTNGWKPVPVNGVEFDLENLPDGTYQLKWWNTTTGVTSRGGVKKVDDGKLNLKIPVFTGDIAFMLLMNH